MKQITIILLLLCCVTLAVAEDTSITARDRAKQRLALRASAQKIMDIVGSPVEFGENESRLLTAELSSRMQQDIKAHADPKVSRKLCAGVLSERYRQAVEHQIDYVIKQAGKNTALPISKEEVMQHIGVGWEQQTAAAADIFAKKHIAATFDKARKQSVALQRDQLKDRIKMPAEHDLNRRLTALAERSGHHPPRTDDFKSMTEWLASFAEDDNTPLYKEVQHSNREVSARIMQRVKKQYGSQLSAIKKSAKNLPHNAIDSETIQISLRDAVDLSTKKMRLDDEKNRSGAKSAIYNPFDVIYAEVERKAETMQEERLVVAILEQKNIPIGSSAVESVLRSDLEAHVFVANSRNLLVTRYASETMPWIIKNLATRARRVGDANFNSKLDSLIKQNKRLEKAVNDFLGKSLDSVLPDIRNKIVTEQLKIVFGGAPDEIEMLSPEAVQAVWDAGYGDPVKNSDKAWSALQSAGLIADGAVKENMLEESRHKIVDISNRLIPVACSAVREQANMLNVLEQEWTPRLRNDIEKNRSVEKITSDWTAELKDRWSEYVEKQSLPYPDLFARTLDMLEKTVRKLFESVEAEMEDQPTEPTPEEAQPVEEPPETPEDSTEVTIEKMLETLDFVLYFRDTSSGASEAVLLDGKGATTRLSFDPSNVKSAVDEVFKTVVPAIESAAASKAKQNPKRKGIIALLTRDRTLDLKIAVLVGSKQVRLIMSILLRNRVELFVEDWNANPVNPTLELEWEDNLEVIQ